MKGYELPTSLSVGGVEYLIRTDYRAVLDVLCAMNDAELDGRGRTAVLLMIMFPELEKMPPEHHEEAIRAACEFIDMGQRDDGKPHPKLVDWEQDAGIIVPAVNNASHTEVRALPYLHWWTFWGYFMEIGESLFSSVLSVRIKKSKHKKLEKWEDEFYREHRELVDLQAKETAEERAAREDIEKWL